MGSSNLLFNVGYHGRVGHIAIGLRTARPSQNKLIRLHTMRGCVVETKELIATGLLFSVTPRSKKLFLATTRVGWPLLDGKPV